MMFPGTAYRKSFTRAAASLAVILCFSAGTAYARGANYDILYLWRSDQAGIKAAKTKISRILGPDVARRLRIVQAGGKYGLVYPRHGNLDTAAAVAKSHNRMMAGHGLQAPVPVKTQDWAAPQRVVPVMQPPPERPAQHNAPAVHPVAADQAPAAEGQMCEPAPLASLHFEDRIDQYLKLLRKNGSIKEDEHTAWTVYDLSDNTKLAGINEDMLLQAASLIKPFVALAFFHEVSQGRQNYNATAQRHMVEMIRDSSNASADWFMRLMGGPASVQHILDQSYGNMLHDLSLVEYIPSNGHTYKNKASVKDYTAFLNALWRDELPSSAEIKRVMLLPKHNRLYTGTQGLPQDTEVYDKTGTTSHLCGDMGILVARRDDGKRFPYIVIGLIQKSSPASRYFSWMRSRGNVIRRISEMAYQEIASRHHFKDHAAVESKPAGPAAVPEAAVISGQESLPYPAD